MGTMMSSFSDLQFLTSNEIFFIFIRIAHFAFWEMPAYIFCTIFKCIVFPCPFIFRSYLYILGINCAGFIYCKISSFIYSKYLYSLSSYFFFFFFIETESGLVTRLEFSGAIWAHCNLASQIQAILLPRLPK